MEKDDKNKNELNYKQAYYYLFNQTTEVIKSLMIIQRKASEICIDEAKQDHTEINIGEVLAKIVEDVKRND